MNIFNNIRNIYGNIGLKKNKYHYKNDIWIYIILIDFIKKIKIFFSFNFNNSIINYI